MDRANPPNFALTIMCTLENHCKSAGARTLLAVSILPWPHFSLYKETCLPRGGSQRSCEAVLREKRSLKQKKKLWTEESEIMSKVETGKTHQETRNAITEAVNAESLTHRL